MLLVALLRASSGRLASSVGQDDGASDLDNASGQRELAGAVDAVVAYMAYDDYNVTVTDMEGSETFKAAAKVGITGSSFSCLCTRDLKLVV
mmetsp:Transcript_16921/g.47230  ORF Transcript_16921/g.47230 Transcript_16921/m.47230 type:complete len:91 (+) Transcript_16921:26-298(+)